MILAKTMDRGRGAISKSKWSPEKMLNKEGVLLDRYTEIRAVIRGTKEQQKLNDWRVHAAKQLKTPKTNVPNKDKNISPKKIEDKTTGDKQSKRIKKNGAESGNMAANKRHP